MENAGVRCNVHDCTYNQMGSECRLGQIEVTNTTSSNQGANAHFCKSYQRK